MKIAVFALGKFYLNRREELLTLSFDDEIVAFFDNKFEKEIEIDGVPSMNPKCINCIEFDCIVIMSTHVREIYNQLRNLGVAKEKIFTWNYFKSKKKYRKIEMFTTVDPCYGEKILIVSNPLRYDGGSMAAIYAAQAIRLYGYCVWIMTSYIEPELKMKIMKEGINLAINTELPFIGLEVIRWIDGFTSIVVNVFNNVQSVYELKKYKPILWWLHESDVYAKEYQQIFNSFPIYQEGLAIDTVNVVAVSEKAKDNFQKYYPYIDVRIMPYGLPDDIIKYDSSNRKLIFGIIGTVIYLKGQDIFIKAAKKIISEVGNDVEFLIIGDIQNDYAKELIAEVENIDYIKIVGEVNRERLKVFLSRIDVIVSASREDSLPIVVTEGMMNGKVCIVSDAIGSVKYIRNMENGIIFKSQNVEELADKMKWCLYNRDEMKIIGSRARKTYEKFFSMDVFADRLSREITYTKEKYDKEII